MSILIEFNSILTDLTGFNRLNMIMSAMQYYFLTQGQTEICLPLFCEREVKIMEITGIALQTVSAGEDVAFTETPVCGSKCIVHRQGSGIIKLRGITNQCKARFLVSYSGNIQIPTGGTVEAISLAIAVDGEPLQSTRMIRMLLLIRSVSTRTN